GQSESIRVSLPPSFRDGAQHQTSDAQLRIGESRDSGFDARPRVYPSSANMVVQVGNSRLGCASPRNDVVILQQRLADAASSVKPAHASLAGRARVLRKDYAPAIVSTALAVPAKRDSPIIGGALKRIGSLAGFSLAAKADRVRRRERAFKASL